MRWDNLFDDLEGQLESEFSADENDLRAEEERLRLGSLTVRDRLFSLKGAVRDRGVRVVLTSGTGLVLRPRTFGRDWVSGEIVDGSSRNLRCIIPIFAISALVLDRTQVTVSIAPISHEDTVVDLSRRLGLSFILRDICRRRASIELELVDGTAYGTIDRVGRDHLDLAVHESGSQRHESAVIHYRIVPFGQIQVVRL